MNKIILMGRLTRDPEVRATNEGKMVAHMSIAVDRRGEGTDFFNLTAFGKVAEFAEKYLKKGTKVVLEGRLQNNNYTDKDGVKHYQDAIIVDSMEFAESKKSQETQEAPSSNPDYFTSIPDNLEDSLPFH